MYENSSPPPIFIFIFEIFSFQKVQKKNKQTKKRQSGECQKDISDFSLGFGPGRVSHRVEFTLINLLNS